MTKIKNPVRFSEHFQIDATKLAALDILDPTLNADTRLFIDPLLIPASRHSEMSTEAAPAYELYFKQAISLLGAIEREGDTYWRNARRLLEFPEIKGTCLGYGANSIAGSGSGRETTDQVFTTAREIVALGVRDPDLFVAMTLLESNFGPDRISDMATNIIFGQLLTLNHRILSNLNVPVEEFAFRLRNGNSFRASLPRNPYSKGKVPIILVPADVLRDLPVASDWQNIARASSESAEIRSRVNEQIAQLWRRKTLEDKEQVKTWALSDKHSFQTLLDMIHAAPRKPYDIVGDPKGEVFWRKLINEIAEKHAFRLRVPTKCDLNGVDSVVQQIIQQFKFLVEERRYSDELYHDGIQRPEKAAQRLFFATAYSYCKANELDITPEADTGNGPVDFKVASGFTGRVLVEIKLSTNKKLIRGYTRQLETYKNAEETLNGYYVVIDVGGSFQKAKKELIRLRDAAIARQEPTSSLIFIDGIQRPSASKL